MLIERQLQGTLNTVFTELIKEKGLEKKILPYTAQEEGRADITLKNSNGKPIFFIELKDPTAKDGRSVFDSSVLMRETERAQKLEIKYFGNCNFLACAFFDKDKLYEKVSVNEGFFTLSEINRLRINFAPGKDLLNKLKIIAQYYLARALEIIERKPITFSNLDEIFIFKIRKLIDVYSYNITEKVWEKYKGNKDFEKKIQLYSQSQLWNKPQTYEEIEKLTHIAVLMLISKLIFYKSYVDNKTWSELSPMKVPDNIDSSETLEKLIWKYFVEFKDITGNFELLIGERSDIVFQMPFVSDAVVDLVKEILDTEGHYNFSNIPFDIIGRIFEELIREDERHKLGQYFTPPHVIDLINSFTIHSERDKVFDPSCGSGTFLVRAYERKKELSKNANGATKRHEVLLNEIYGNDISGYPAYLSMLNLAIRNTMHPSYPRILNKDFFSFTSSSKVDLYNQYGKTEKKTLPKFDAIIGNPPYTRQKDIGAMDGTVSQNKIQLLIKSECYFNPSQRTSIYGYFFYHATTFLKDNGFLGYICQNSWLETDYGIDMQRYILRNYQIIAIMDSEVERFFPTASVNTTIVILKKQIDEKLRNNNIVRFMYFTKPLNEIIKTNKGINNLHDVILNTTNNKHNDFYRINCLKQETLLHFTKWTQFLKAPKVYFDILEKGKGKFKKLSGNEGISSIQRGITSGCNEYFFGDDVTDVKQGFYLTTCMNNTKGLKSINELNKLDLRIFKNGLNECWLTEKDFLKNAIKLTRDISHYIINKVNPQDVMFYVNKLNEFKSKKGFNITKYRNYLEKKFPYAYTYIRYGNKKEIKGTIVSQKPTCASRPAWWDLGKQKKMDFISLRFRDKRNWLPIVESDFLLGDVAFFGKFKNQKLKKQYSIILNSTFSILQTELLGRVNLGDGLLTTYGPDLEVMQVLDIIPSKVQQKEVETVYNSLKGIKAISIFEELGTDNESSLSLKKVAKHRLDIDNLFLKLLGYNNLKEREELLFQLYVATINLIKGRINKAQSLKSVKTKRNKILFSVYIKQLNKMLIEGKYEAKITIKFTKQLKKLVSEISSDNKLQKKILDAYWKEKFKSTFNKKEIANEGQLKMF